MKITVLAGGFSPERDVSLLSGALIAKSLCRSGHLVALTDVFYPYRGALSDDAFTSDGNFMYTIPKEPPSQPNPMRNQRTIVERRMMVPAFLMKDHALSQTLLNTFPTVGQ